MFVKRFRRVYIKLLDEVLNDNRSLRKGISYVKYLDGNKKHTDLNIRIQLFHTFLCISQNCCGRPDVLLPSDQRQL